MNLYATAVFNGVLGVLIDSYRKIIATMLPRRILKFIKYLEIAFLQIRVARRKKIRIDRMISVALFFLFNYFFDYRHALRKGYIFREETTGEVVYTEDVLKKLDKVILSKMHFMQYKIDLHSAKFFHLSMRKGGFGYSVLYPLASSLALAYLYNRTVVLHPVIGVLYEFPFKPIGAYTWDILEGEVGYNKAKKFKYSPQKDRHVESITEEYGWRFMRKSDACGDVMSFTESLRKLPDSFVYFVGLVLDSFVEMQEDYQAHIQERISETKLLEGGPVIGAHIRHGDVHTSHEDAYRRYTTSYYFRMIEDAVERTNIRNVFIATDNNKVLNQLPKDSGINFIYDDEEKRYDNSNAGMLYENPMLRKQETLTALKNVYMLGACDYIIGSWGAQFTRFSSAIAYFRRKKRNLILIRGNTTSFITDDDLHTVRDKDGKPVSILSQW